MKSRLPVAAAHHTDTRERYSAHWWWLPTLGWVSAIGAVAWLAISVEPATTSPSAGTTASEPLPPPPVPPVPPVPPIPLGA